MKYIKTMWICIILLSMSIHAYSQEVDLKEFNQALEKTEQAKQTQSIKINGKYQLIAGIGYQKLLWRYTTSTPSNIGGLSETIHQGSEYDGMNINVKFLVFRPLGILTRLSFFIPLSITETIYPTTTENGISVVSNSRYVLKNVGDKKSKGLGIDLLLGPSFRLMQDNVSINLGGGIGWISFFEDIGTTDRASSLLGLGIDVDVQWLIKKFFGVSVGIHGEYYPFSINDTNNKVSSSGGAVFTLDTNYMTSIGGYVGTSWYF